MDWRKLGIVAAMAMAMVALGAASQWSKLPPMVAATAGAAALMIAGAMRSYLQPKLPPAPTEPPPEGGAS